MSNVNDPVITVESVVKKFGDFTAINNVSFEVERNTIFGLLGSNGAGKSTMMHILTGLLNASSGEITILGEKLKRKYSQELKRKVSIVPQEISLYEDLTIYDNLHFFGKAYVSNNKELEERIIFLSRILQLGDLKRKVKHLSGGYQRRVSIGVALIGNPDILVLDEAFVGIDLETKKILLDLLLQLKRSKTIIFTTHSMDEAQKICDYVCFFHKGNKIKEGKTRDILEEFSTHHGSQIIVSLINEEYAKKVAELVTDSNVEITLEGKVLKIKSLSSEYDLSNILRFFEKIGKYRGAVVDVEVVKPGLGDVMLELIERGLE